MAVPMTKLVKEKVEELASKQGITNIKFTNKKGETLATDDWITGVDYDVIGEEVEPTDEQEDIEDDKEPEEQVVAQVANPNHGELVEEIEEVD